MLIDSVELQDDVKWALRPRKFKRKCEYLENSKPVLSLPLPVVLAKPVCETQTICQPQKKFRLYKPNIENPLKFIPNPIVIITRLHIFLNFFIVSVFIFLICYILFCASRDISYGISLKRAETRSLIEEARKLYVLNKCDPTTRVPALQLQCDQWEHLVKSGFYSIKYTKIVVEMLADVLDGFVSKFKFKSLAVIVTFMCYYLLFKRKS